MEHAAASDPEAETVPATEPPMEMVAPADTDPAAESAVKPPAPGEEQQPAIECPRHGPLVIVLRQLSGNVRAGLGTRLLALGDNHLE